MTADKMKVVKCDHCEKKEILEFGPPPAGWYTLSVTWHHSSGGMVIEGHACCSSHIEPAISKLKRQKTEENKR